MTYNRVPSSNPQITISEFTQYCNEFNRWNAIPFNFDESELRLLFNSFKSQNNRECQYFIRHLRDPSKGFTSALAFSPSLCSRGDRDLKQKIQEIFRLFDQNKSGRLNKQQLKNYYNTIYAQSGINFKMTEQHVETVLVTFGKPKNGGFDQMDFYYIVKIFKNLPMFKQR